MAIKSRAVKPKSKKRSTVKPKSPAASVRRSKALKPTGAAQTLEEQLAQRENELAILNSVGEAMTKTLDVKTVTRIVGDKVRDIFKAEVTEILLLDTAANLIHVPYSYYRGYQEVDPFAFGQGLTSRVITTRRPLLFGTGNEQTESGGINITEDDLTESYMGTPIIVGDKVLGVVSVQSYQQYAYNDDHLRLLQTLASNMGIAIQNARLFEAEQERAAELAIISSVQEGLASKLEFQSIIDLVGDKIVDIFKSPLVSIMLYDRQANLETYPYMFEKGHRLHQEPIPNDDTGFGRQAMRRRQPVLINFDMQKRMEEVGSYLIGGEGDATKSAIYAPILAGNEARGVVSIGVHDRENAYTESDVHLLQTLANAMSVALENARLFDETQRLLKETEDRAAELTAISTVSQSLVAETELGSMIQLIGSQMRAIFDADIVYVALLDPQTNLIHFPYQIGETFITLQVGEGMTGRIIQTGEPVLLNKNVRERIKEIGVRNVGREVLSYLGVPVKSAGETIGVISVQSTTTEGLFNEDSMRLLTTIAANVGAAIQTAQLHAETGRRAQETAVLAEVGREISATLDLPTVLSAIASRAQVLFHARDVVLRLLEPDGSLPVVVALGKYAELYKTWKSQMGHGLTGHIAQTGVAELINEPLKDPRMVRIAGTEEDEENEVIIFAPLFSGEKVIGMMSVWRDKTLHGSFTQSDLDFTVGLARQAAIAIQNARLFAEIKRQGEFVETVLANISVAVTTVNEKGEVLGWNPAAEKLFGWTRAEAIGRNVDDLVSNADLREEAVRYSEQSSQGTAIHSITRRVRKDGSLVDVELSALPLPLESGYTGGVAIYHDISELQRARHEAEQARDTANR